MSTSTTERRAAHHLTDGSWDIELVRRPGSFAEVRRVDDRLHLWLGDDHQAGHAPGEAGSSTDAVLHDDGRALVTCCAAPPALVVAPGRSCLLPAVPGTPGVERLRDGDLLVMCSASALDHLPAGIGAVLAWAPLELAARHADVLLDRLMEDTDAGSALLARYRAR